MGCQSALDGYSAPCLSRIDGREQLRRTALDALDRSGMPGALCGA